MIAYVIKGHDTSKKKDQDGFYYEKVFARCTLDVEIIGLLPPMIIRDSEILNYHHLMIISCGTRFESSMSFSL